MTATLLAFNPVRRGLAIALVLVLGVVALLAAIAAAWASSSEAGHTGSARRQWANAVSAVGWPVVLAGLWVFPFTRDPSFDPPKSVNAFPTRPAWVGPVVVVALVAGLGSFIAAQRGVGQRSSVLSRVELIVALVALVLLAVEAAVLAPGILTIAFGAWVSVVFAAALALAAAIRVLE